MDGITGVGNRISKQVFGGGREEAPERTFQERFTDMLDDVNRKQHTADASMDKVVKGELGLHEGMLSIQEADISLRYLVQVRAKIMQAYNEIIKMPI